MWSGALIRREDKVLLVRQQGPDDPDARWVVPGGVVEEGEFAVDAMVREIREETGLRVTDPGRLVAVSQYQVAHPVWGGAWTAFLFEVTAAGRLGSADPDGVVFEAAWLPVRLATSRLAELEFAPMREPAIHRLRDPAGPTPVLWTWPGEVSTAVPVLVPGTAVTAN
jgi:8-oxo-dGTP diphosphatase